MAKIGFVGTHCTGKTTLLNMIKFPGYKMVTQIVRNLAVKGVPINKETNDLSQLLIFNRYLDILLTEDNFISDRTILDVFAYTYHAYTITHKVSEEVFNYIRYCTQKYISEYNKLYFHPIEFSMTVDEARIMDEEYRKYIEDVIKMHLKLWDVEYYTLTGSAENKFKTFETSLLP